MNILQTIWSVLTSHDSFTVNMSTIPLIPVEITLFVLLATAILGIVSGRKQIIVCIISFSCTSLLTQFLIPTPFNIILNIVTLPVLIFFIFKTTIIKAVLGEIVPFVIAVVFNIISQNLFLLIFNIPVDSIQYIPLYRILFSCTNYLAMLLLYLFIIKLDFSINLSDIVKRRTNFILVFNLVIGIIGIAVISYFLTFYGYGLSPSINTLTVLVLLIYFLISMYSLYRTNKLEVTSKNLEDEKLYNKTLTILHDNIRGFKHDFNNIVQSIGGYVYDENMSGLKEYYTQLLDDCQRINALATLSPNVINNPAVYSLITSKYHKAESLGINMKVNVFMDLSKINMKIYELTRVLGILLDNSIEASSECTNKTITITVRKDAKANRQLFIIENTYINKDVDTDKIFEKGYTSKTDTSSSHGLGLWEARAIMRKNNNLNLFTNKNDTFFIQQLEIYC